MKQIARNLTDCDDGFFLGTRFVIMDRDARFSEAFRGVLACGGVTPIRLPARSPNLSAYMERFFHSLKNECLDRMVFLGEKSVRVAVQEFVEHYHRERNHQGIGMA